ncbi:hypothetical protein [Nesterenkonia flava]|uniref:Uncharacterized protein n=1 Tax=Nesterenkonia flava TaxID=469799 RepID=A0ABU1FT81_9MICC|nr:hypothetical protein [Nesterenkonia flava]MDR5711378.1 hypothetical protein [Nesterenkonia flava]
MSEQPLEQPLSWTDEHDAPVHSFTRDWWGRLPQVYQQLDRVQRPYPVPLLRYLDGVGHLAGQVRDLNNRMWSGELLDLDGAPDRLLPWLAYLLGFPEEQRRASSEQLRERLRSHVSGGGHPVGTRGHIAETVRGFLRPGAPVQVFASSQFPWTLIIGVNKSDVPGGDYLRLEERIRAAGVIPAGHALRLQEVLATWDQWEAAAGQTWEEVQGNIRTWQDSDSAGVELQ